MVETDRVVYKKSNFYQKLLEVHELMRKYDKLIPNTDSVKFEASQPHHWLLNRETMQLWKEDVGLQVATALNPAVAWAGCAVTAVYMLFSILNSLLSKRGIQWPSFTRSQGNSEWRGESLTLLLPVLPFLTYSLLMYLTAFQTLPPKEFYLQSFGFLFTAILSTSALTYVLPMQTNLSDSLLTMYFMTMGTAVAFEVISIRLALSLRLILFIAILVVSSYSFYKLIPTTYGIAWTKTDCEMSSSKFNCHVYPTPTVNTQSEQERQSVYIDVFGDTYTIDYQPGEEEDINVRAREIKFNAWKAKTYGTKVKERYIGVQSTPAASYAEVKESRKKRYKQMTENYLRLHPEEQINDAKKDDTANQDASEQDVNDSEQKAARRDGLSNESQESSQVDVNQENSQIELKVTETERTNMANDDERHQESIPGVDNADVSGKQVVIEDNMPPEEAKDQQSEERDIQEQQVMDKNNENQDTVKDEQPTQDASVPEQVQQSQEGESFSKEM